MGVHVCLFRFHDDYCTCRYHAAFQQVRGLAGWRLEDTYLPISGPTQLSLENVVCHGWVQALFAFKRFHVWIWQ